MSRFQCGQRSGKLLNIAMFFSGLCSDLRKLISQGLIISSPPIATTPNPAILRGFLCLTFGLWSLRWARCDSPVPLLCLNRTAEFKRAIENDPSTLLEPPLTHIDSSIGRARVGNWERLKHFHSEFFVL